MTRDDAGDEASEANEPAFAMIERVLAAYRGLVPPEMLEVLREELRYGVTEHPVGKQLASRVRERAAPLQSGEVGDVDGAAALDDTGSGGKR